MGLLCCAAKCCGCMALSQLCALLLPLGILAALGLLFYTYAIPWGEDQIREALNLASDVDIGDLNASYVEANSCSGCVFGSNTQWPTNTTGTRHFLDSKAGTTASGVIATSLAGAAVIGTGSMLWASAMPSAAAALSFSGGFYEMTHIVEQAQFAGMISQLRIEGAPTFLMQFSKELSWTNFNLIKGSSDDSSSSGSASDGTRRLADSSSSATGFVAAAGESGPARYASLIGVDADDLFFYTLVTFVVVVAVLHALYLVFIMIVGAISKSESFGEVARKWYRKVIWAGVLALLLAQYMFAMAGSYFVSEGSSNDSANGSSSRYALGIVALAAVVLLALGLGVIVVGNNTDELKDLGTYEHDQRAFSSKYSAYYDEYNFDNRFFFVPRILLAVMTGVVVGIVRDATTQLLCILAITMVYLILLLIRQPNLLRFLYYIGIASVFLKVVLICLMLIVARDDYFPQNVRDNVAYGIIGVNMFIFFLLFVRQAYTIIHKMIIACRHKKNGKDSSLDATDINLEFGNNTSTNVRSYEQSSRSGHSENVPMLEPPPEPVPVFSRSRTKIRPPVSRNQQYLFGGSTRSAEDLEVNNAAPALLLSLNRKSQPAPSTARQQFNPGASTVNQQHFAPGASTASSFAMMQSYVNFSDSMASSVSSQSTVKQDNTFSAAMGAAAHHKAKMSIFSNDSDNSFDGDSSGWFKARSKTVVSTDEDGSEANDVEGQSYELGPLGVTKSAFSRDSIDSYGYQSKANFASSRVDFNAQSRITNTTAATMAGITLRIDEDQAPQTSRRTSLS
ncbi:TRP-like family [Phytophthora cactorum]|nr:TRP-like family [Phytophthora cactorum]